MTTYYDQNRDELKEKQREYYQANKDKINEKARNNKRICECGSSFEINHAKRHYDTKKHQNFISNKSEYSSMIEEARELFYSHYDSSENKNNEGNNIKK